MMKRVEVIWKKFNEARGEKHRALKGTISVSDTCFRQAGHRRLSPVLSTSCTLCYNTYEHGRIALSCIFHIVLGQYNVNRSDMGHFWAKALKIWSTTPLLCFLPSVSTVSHRHLVMEPSEPGLLNKVMYGGTLPLPQLSHNGQEMRVKKKSLLW